MPQRQQNGYACSIVPARNSTPRSVRSSTIVGSASLTKSPRTNAGARSLNSPASSTGLNTGHPCARPIARSSGPNAGAMCTIPVPSSIETKSPATTMCAPSTFG